MSLNGMWSLRAFTAGTGEAEGAHLPGNETGEWLLSDVPGDVHTTLQTAGVIEDPYYHDYIERCRWVEEREWWYRCRFHMPTDLQGDRIELVFKGLDTYATIYLDGQPLGSTRNMFREYRFDVTGLIQPDTHHTLAARLDPAAPLVEQIHQERGHEIHGFWSVFHDGRVWVRKSQMHFGWDWAPRLVVSGIRQDVELHAYPGACIRQLFPQVLSIGNGEANLRYEAGLERFADKSGEQFELRFILEEPNGEHRWQPVQVTPAAIRWEGVTGHAEAQAVLPNPRLWWTSDLGAQPLYRLRAELLRNGVPVHDLAKRFGIRTIELQPSNFTFILNNVPIFCRGANWIPADGRTGAILAERYRRLIESAREANLNMLRVWGGGIYEPDLFYDLCDEAGILVWQDFMFSCATYPDHDEEFTAEAEAEAACQIRRLRHHACLALWCGNNECQWIDDQMHWQQRNRRVPGSMLYDEVFPRLCADLDPAHAYVPGSPYGGDDYNDEREGDRHNWQVWGGHIYPHRFGEQPRYDPSPSNVNFRQYAQDTTRFCSEFGIHGSPPLTTLRQTIPPGELYYVRRVSSTVSKTPIHRAKGACWRRISASHSS